MNNSQKVVQLKTDIQGCTASIAHKGDLIKELLHRAEELKMEIKEDVARRDYYSLQLKDINTKESL